MGQAAVQVRAGDSMAPIIEINGITADNGWAGGEFPTPAPDAIVVNVLP